MPLADGWLLSLTKLQGLNIQGIVLSDVSQSTYTILYSTGYLVSTDNRHRCIPSNIHYSHEKARGGICTRLLSHASIGTFILCFGITIFFFVALTTWINIRLHFKKKPVIFILMNVFLLGTALGATYLTMIALVANHFGNYYVIVRLSWVGSVSCRALSAALSISINLSTISSAVLHHVAFMAVCNTVFSEEEYRALLMKVFLPDWIWIRCRRCSNFIFILDWLQWVGKDNCKTKRETFKLWDLVRLVLEVWR